MAELLAEPAREPYEHARDAGAVTVVCDQSSPGLASVVSLQPLFVALQREAPGRIAFLRGGVDAVVEHADHLLEAELPAASRKLSIEVCRTSSVRIVSCFARPRK